MTTDDYFLMAKKDYTMALCLIEQPHGNHILLFFKSNLVLLKS